MVKVTKTQSVHVFNEPRTSTERQGKLSVQARISQLILPIGQWPTPSARLIVVYGEKRKH
jgi:hypothetical protein